MPRPVAKPRSRKRCRTCQSRKAVSRFPRNSQRPDGLDSECRNCKSTRSRTWYRKRQQETQGLYSTFIGMKLRCHNPQHDHYRYYGGRGIQVCAAWRWDFPAFFAWAVSQGYRPELQIDRIDNEDGYHPENCRFVTPSENARNKRKPQRSPPTPCR